MFHPSIKGALLAALSLFSGTLAAGEVKIVNATTGTWTLVRSNAILGYQRPKVEPTWTHLELAPQRTAALNQAEAGRLRYYLCDAQGAHVLVEVVGETLPTTGEVASRLEVTATPAQDLVMEGVFNRDHYALLTIQRPFPEAKPGPEVPAVKEEPESKENKDEAPVEAPVPEPTPIICGGLVPVAAEPKSQAVDLAALRSRLARDLHAFETTRLTTKLTVLDFVQDATLIDALGPDGTRNCDSEANVRIVSLNGVRAEQQLTEDQNKVRAILEALPAPDPTGEAWFKQTRTRLDTVRLGIKQQMETVKDLRATVEAYKPKR